MAPWAAQEVQESKARKTESGRKLTLAGYMSRDGPKRKLSLNGLQCADPMPSRLRIWTHLFKTKNQQLLVKLDNYIRAELESAPPKLCAKFMKQDAADWAFQLGNLELTLPGERTCWSEAHVRSCSLIAGSRLKLSAVNSTGRLERPLFLYLVCR